MATFPIGLVGSGGLIGSGARNLAAESYVNPSSYQTTGGSYGSNTQSGGGYEGNRRGSNDNNRGGSTFGTTFGSSGKCCLCYLSFCLRLTQISVGTTGSSGGYGSQGLTRPSSNETSSYRRDNSPSGNRGTDYRRNGNEYESRADYRDTKETHKKNSKDSKDSKDKEKDNKDKERECPECGQKIKEEKDKKILGIF